MLVFGVLALTSCSNVCGATSMPAPSASPNITEPAAGPSPKLPVAGASCKAESTSHSLNSNKPTSFTITNQTSVALTLFWLDFQGHRVKYTDVAPGATKSQGTYITHPWVVADPQGTCIRLFLVTEPTHITIG